MRGAGRRIYPHRKVTLWNIPKHKWRSRRDPARPNLGGEVRPVAQTWPAVLKTKFQ